MHQLVMPFAFAGLEVDGYEAVQLAYDTVPARKLSKPELGHLEHFGIGPHRTLVEFRGGIDGAVAGEAVTVELFAPGDTIKVSVKVVEGDRERVQAFEGVCIARQGQGLNESFTVRKVSYGEGVERVFPIHSPKIAKVEVKRTGRVRRAKLYYLRDRVGKATRLRERKVKGADGAGKKKAKVETKAPAVE